MRLRSCLAAVVLSSATFVAHADTFNFTFGGSSDAFSGSGVLTGTLEVTQEYLITAVNGTAETSPNGAALTITSILAPGTFPTETNGGLVPPNDNTLFVVNGIGNFSQDGISFILSNGAQINLYDDGPSDDALLERKNGNDVSENVPITITAGDTVAATPEPSSFALLGTGLLGVAGVLKRRLA